MILVALYARVSTEEQTVDNQIIRLKEVAEARGYEIFGVYVDTASGANARRPQLDRMLADAKAHRFDRIMSTKLDRLARSVTNLSSIMQSLESWQVSVEFLDQPIDTSTASGKLALTVLGAVAEFERELIRDRTCDGQRRARAEGKRIGRPPRELTAYQKEKIAEILAAEPDISAHRLAQRFDGISPHTLIKLARQEGLIERR